MQKVRIHRRLEGMLVSDGRYRHQQVWQGLTHAEGHKPVPIASRSLASGHGLQHAQVSGPLCDLSAS